MENLSATFICEYFTCHVNGDNDMERTGSEDMTTIFMINVTIFEI